MQSICSPYKTDGNIIMNYKFGRTFLLKNELQFVNKILFYICKMMWPGKPALDSNAQKTSVFHPFDPILSNSHRK